MGHNRASMDHLSRKRGEYECTVCSCLPTRSCLYTKDEGKQAVRMKRFLPKAASIYEKKIFFLLHLKYTVIRPVRELSTTYSDLKLDRPLPTHPTPPPPFHPAPVVRFVFGLCMQSQSMETVGCHGNNLKRSGPFCWLALVVWHVETHTSL